MTVGSHRHETPVDGAFVAAMRRYAALCAAGRYHDAHDVLEALWLRLPLRTPPWCTLRKLIQVAAAFHHHAQGNATGARRTLARVAAAPPVLEAVGPPHAPQWHEIDGELRAWLRTFDREAESWAFPEIRALGGAGHRVPGGTEV